MAKTTKKDINYGKVEMPESAFKDENTMAHISMRLPLPLLKGLRKAALTEEYQGKYQVLMRDILTEWIEHNKAPKKKKA